MPENPFHFSPGEVVGFVLVLMRVAGIFLTAPVFSSRQIPVLLKASWVLLTAFLIFPIVPLPTGDLPAPGLAFGLAVVRELLLGFSIGLAATLVFTGIQLAGQIIDIQMGLGMANIIDPVTATQISVMGQFYFMVATLVYLSADGHHLLLRGIMDSFGVVPLGGAHFTPALGSKMMEIFTQVFFIAFRVGAPVIGALFITNMTLGIIARTVPQMNVFIVGMPLGMAVGLIITAFSMGFFSFMLQGLFKGMHRDFAILLRALH
ncbi:MAG TPA: flagellar biosynthetic protein FliR [bacterium]|nr:flagellar biosynthetic protein FliR [bacterium]